MKTFDSFDDAVQFCGENQTVCGTLKVTGKPVYFVVPAATPDAEIETLAFKLRHGHEPSEAEKLLAKLFFAQVGR